MNILITGGCGFVGANLARIFATPVFSLAGARRTVVADLLAAPPVPQTNSPDDTDYVCMDIRDEESVRAAIESTRPDAVIHAAGDKNVKRCQADPEAADRTNAVGARNVARACQAVGAMMVYLSTDMVFEGSRGGYREDESPQPACVYGTSKLGGERLAQAECDRLAICRTGGVYGPCSPLLGWLDGELCAGRPIEAFTNVFNSPTSVQNLAEMLDYVIAHRLTGVFHTVGRQRASRFDLFTAYALAFEREASLIHRAAYDPASGQMLLPDSSLSADATADRIRVPFNSLAEGLARWREKTSKQNEGRI